MGECKICGKRLILNKFQARKIICAKCSYELKKTRIKRNYWKNKPESKQFRLWDGRLRAMMDNIFGK
jgi:ribosomal protein L37E